MSTGYWVGAVDWSEFSTGLKTKEPGDADKGFCKFLWDCNLEYDILFPYNHGSGWGQDAIEGYLEIRKAMPSAKALLVDQLLGTILSEYMNKKLTDPDFDPESINAFDVEQGAEYMEGLTAILSPKSVAKLDEVWKKIDLTKLRSIARSNWEEKTRFEYGDDFVDYLEIWGAFIERAHSESAGMVIYHT